MCASFKVPLATMEGFKQDCDKLFQLFQAQSRVTPHLTDPTVAGGGDSAALSTTSSSSSSQPGDTSCKVSNNFSFCQFIKCFKQLKFSAIFCGHKSANSLREFFDQVNKFLLGQLSDKHPIEIRIFSFYLLYALWFLQSRSYNLPFKIRLDKQSYANVQTLVKDSSQIDIELAYRNLYLAGAFVFVENIEQYGPYFKEYLAKKTCPINQETEEFKRLQKDYLDLLQEQPSLHDTNMPNCDKLIDLMKKFEDNCL